MPFQNQTFTTGCYGFGGLLLNAQATLSWPPGTSKVAHLEENVAAAAIRLEEREMLELRKAA